MAFFQIGQVAVRGVAAAVPGNCHANADLPGYSDEERRKLIATLGIEYRRVATENQCASDLCMAAAQRVMEALKWSPGDIEALFFVTQTPDFSVPGTSMYIQKQLGLDGSCATFDINQGCAGYVYGLSLASSFMSASGIKKGLLLVGDTITKLVSPHDKSLLPIFSDCGTATALEYSHNAPPMVFNTGSEGADYEAIFVPQGGGRSPLSEESFLFAEGPDSIPRKGYHLTMKGLDVFNFSLKKVAPNIEELLRLSAQDRRDIDYFVFHQANRLILESIAKKLDIPADKVPSTLRLYGNTSGATVPLTIVSELRRQNAIVDARLLLSGFGVGLSLASAIVNFNGVICPELAEI